MEWIIFALFILITPVVITWFLFHRIGELNRRIERLETAERDRKPREHRAEAAHAEAFADREVSQPETVAPEEPVMEAAFEEIDVPQEEKTPAGPAEAPVEPAKAPVGARLRAPKLPRMSPPDLERLLGGRVFNWIGAVAISVAFAFFIKHAFDQGWINLIGRFALGLTLGSGLVGLGQWLSSRGQTLASRGLVGAGLSILYTTFFVAHNVYGLLSAPLAVVGVFAVTALGVGIALRENSHVIASVALVGGLLAPLLVRAQGVPYELQLYAVGLTALGLVLSSRKNWVALDGIVLLGLFLVWQDGAPGLGYYVGEALFLLALGGIPIARRWFANAPLRISDLVLSSLGTLVVAIRSARYLEQTVSLEASAIPLAVMALLQAGLFAITARRQAEDPRTTDVFLGFACAYTLFAVPAGLNGMPVAVVWIAVGCALLAVPAFRRPWVPVAAGLLFALGAFKSGLELIDLAKAGWGVTVYRDLLLVASAAGLLWAGRRLAGLWSGTSFRWAGWGVFAAGVGVASWIAPVELLARDVDNEVVGPVLALLAVLAAMVGWWRSDQPLGWSGLALAGLGLGAVFTTATGAADATLFLNSKVLLAMIALGLAAVAVRMVSRIPRLESLRIGVSVIDVAVAIATTIVLSADLRAHAESSLAFCALWTGHAAWLAWMAERRGSRSLAWTALGHAVPTMLGLAAMAAQGYSEVGRVLINANVLGMLGITAAMGLLALWTQRSALVGSVLFTRGFGIAVGALGCGILTSDVWHHAVAGPEGARRAHAMVSVTWAAYAGAAIVLGFLKRSTSARWFGLTVFVLLIGKVVFVDLSGLPTLYRVLSFLVAGLALIGVSALYGSWARLNEPKPAS